VGSEDGWRPFTALERAMTRRMTIAAGIPIAAEWLQVDVAASFARVAQLREQQLPVTLTTIVLAATARGLRAHPQLAAEVDYDGRRLRLPDTLDVGVAVASERGLVVPIVRDVLGRTFPELAVELARVVAEARGGSKEQQLYTGGHFTITNIAAGGVEGGTPIMNAPQVAILGIGAAHEAPVVKDGRIEISTVAQFTISLDHRIVDGITAANFLSGLRTSVESPVEMTS